MGGWLLAAVAPQPSDAIPSGYGGALAKMLVALALVCALAYLLLRAARRYMDGGRGGGRVLRVVERCPLSSRQSVWIVRVGERYFLLASGDGGGVRRLAELDPSELQHRAGPVAPPVGRFAELLRRKASRRRDRGGG